VVQETAWRILELLAASPERLTNKQIRRKAGGDLKGSVHHMR
jgi:hypothetical protein